MSSVVDTVVGDAVRRLDNEFAGWLCPYAVAEVVALAREDLDSCPAPALAELVERLHDNA